MFSHVQTNKQPTFLPECSTHWSALNILPNSPRASAWRLSCLHFPPTRKVTSVRFLGNRLRAFLTDHKLHGVNTSLPMEESLGSSLSNNMARLLRVLMPSRSLRDSSSVFHLPVRAVLESAIRGFAPHKENECWRSRSAEAGHWIQS